jgi:hypothetical protein
MEMYDAGAGGVTISARAVRAKRILGELHHEYSLVLAHT